jgi:hypothetical protein
LFDFGVDRGSWAGCGWPWRSSLCRVRGVSRSDHLIGADENYESDKDCCQGPTLAERAGASQHTLLVRAQRRGSESLLCGQGFASSEGQFGSTDNLLVAVASEKFQRLDRGPVGSGERLSDSYRAVLGQ